jgi:hypothetical protein
MIKAEQRLLQRDATPHRWSSNRVPLPKFIRVTAWMLIGFFIITGFFVLVSRSSDARFDPFDAYASVMPGQTKIDAEAYGFSCEYDSSLQWDECVLQPASGSFSRVWLSLDNRIVSSVLFTPLRGMLTLGDLALVLGAPERKGADHFSWYDDSFVAYIPTNDGRLNYFVQVRNILVR